jgi:geranylgeranyl diphosphate synthase, type II
MNSSMLNAVAPGTSYRHATVDAAEESFRSLMEVDESKFTSLSKALLHVLDHPGSLVRSRLAWNVGLNCGLPGDVALRLATAVEYFHTASLIFDDLPSMDDAQMRRGVPCVHTIYGESVAMLTALAFVNRAYALIWTETSKLLPRLARDITGFVEECLGVNGVLAGQCRDLNFKPGPEDTKEILRISMGKTVTLLRLSLCLPAMVANAPARTLSLLRRLAVFRGLGYQIADDFKDVFQSETVSGKTTDRDRQLLRPNIVVSEGVPSAARRLASLVKQGDCCQKQLRSSQGNWRFLDQLRITVGPDLINESGIPISGNL